MMKGQSKGLFMVLVGGAITISIFGLLILYILQGGQDSYPAITYNQSQYAAFDQTSDVVNLTQQMNDAFTDVNGTGTGAGDIITVSTTGGYNSIKILLSSVKTWNSLIYSAATIIGIPSPVVVLLGYFVLAAFISLVILLVFRVYVS